MKKYLISIGISTAISAIMVGSLFLFANEKFNELSDKLARLASLGASQAISSLTSMSSIDDADTIPVVDNSGTPTTKKITWGNATSTLKTFYDTVYSPIFSTSATLAGLLSDETGSSGGVVRAGSPTISGAQLTSTPTLTDPVLNGTITGTGVLGIAQGGTGSTTKTSALNALLPTQTGNSGKYLQTNATDASWSALSFPAGFGASSTALTENGSGVLTWQHPAKYTWTTGSTVVATSTSEVSVSSAGYALARQIYSPQGGSLTVNFNCKDINGVFTYFCRTYVNGTAYGSEHTGNSSSYVNFSETVAFPPNSYIQIYAHGVGGTNTYVGTFFLSGSLTSTSTIVDLTPQI